MNPNPVIDPDVFFPPGSFILTEIEGWTGRWVSAAQAFVRGGSQWTHAAISVGGGYMVEAQPGGAVRSRVDRLLDGRRFMVSDDPVRLAIEGALQEAPKGFILAASYEEQLRESVVQAAEGLVGTPYSFVDYVALAALEAGLGKLSTALRRYVQNSGHLICSALVDRAYSRAGIELFRDGRFAGDVTPGDLDQWIQVARRSDLDFIGNPDPRTLTLRSPGFQVPRSSD